MTYEEVESAILDHVNTNWSETDAILIGEYYSKNSSAENSIEVSIGIESDEATFGTFDGNTKNMNIQSGTVNLTLSLENNIGRTEAQRLIGLARGLFHNLVLQGYIKFRGSVKRNLGSFDGKLIKLIVCPFTAEIIE